MTEGVSRGGQAWNMRGFISLLLMLQTMIVILSGVVRYFSPRGREAHWVDWRVLNLDKDQWSSIHVVFSLLFVILMVVHLLYNWRPMVNYVRRRTQAARRCSREVVLSVLLTAGVLGLAVADCPPVSLLFAYSEQWKDAYAASVQRAPWAHAEEATLETVCRRQGCSIEETLKVLREAGLPARDSTAKLIDIARQHGTSPLKVFQVITGRVGPGTGSAGAGGLKGACGQESVGCR